MSTLHPPTGYYIEKITVLCEDIEWYRGKEDHWLIATSKCGFWDTQRNVGRLIEQPILFEFLPTRTATPNLRAHVHALFQKEKKISMRKRYRFESNGGMIRLPDETSPIYFSKGRFDFVYRIDRKEDTHLRLQEGNEPILPFPLEDTYITREQAFREDVFPRIQEDYTGLPKSTQIPPLSLFPHPDEPVQRTTASASGRVVRYCSDLAMPLPKEVAFCASDGKTPS